MSPKWFQEATNLFIPLEIQAIMDDYVDINMNNITAAAVCEHTPNIVNFFDFHMARVEGIEQEEIGLQQNYFLQEQQGALQFDEIVWQHHTHRFLKYSQCVGIDIKQGYEWEFSSPITHLHYFSRSRLNPYLFTMTNTTESKIERARHGVTKVENGVFILCKNTSVLFYKPISDAMKIQEHKLSFIPSNIYVDEYAKYVLLEDSGANKYHLFAGPSHCAPFSLVTVIDGVPGTSFVFFRDCLLGCRDKNVHQWLIKNITIEHTSVCTEFDFGCMPMMSIDPPNGNRPHRLFIQSKKHPGIVFASNINTRGKFNLDVTLNNFQHVSMDKSDAIYLANHQVSGFPASLINTPRGVLKISNYSWKTPTKGYFQIVSPQGQVLFDPDLQIVLIFINSDSNKPTIQSIRLLSDFSTSNIICSLTIPHTHPIVKLLSVSSFL